MEAFVVLKIKLELKFFLLCPCMLFVILFVSNTYWSKPPLNQPRLCCE